MIGFIGGGNMAEAIISGLKASGKKKIIVSDKRVERLEYLKEKFDVMTYANNKEIISTAANIILAVKPQNMDEIIKEIMGNISDKHLFISIAAGIRLEYLSESLKTKRLIRVMPNTPALVGEGMSVLSLFKGIKKKDIKTALDIFRSIGEVMILDEDKMDVVTALSGSGPAFFAYFIESLVEAGIRMGLSAPDALTLTLQTGLGTIKMLKEGYTFTELKQMVTSPGGTTAEGMYRLDRNSFKAAVREALEAATQRSKELSRMG